MVLGFSCALPAPHAVRVNATDTDAAASPAACQPHTTWLDVSVTILVSALVSSVIWASEKERSEDRDHPGGVRAGAEFLLGAGQGFGGPQGGSAVGGRPNTIER